MGLAKCLKNKGNLDKDKSKGSGNQHHQDLLRRSAALAIQTCVLNGFSLVACGLGAATFALSDLLYIVHFPTAGLFMFEIYDGYLSCLQYAMVICSSNIGFIVHC